MCVEVISDSYHYTNLKKNLLAFLSDCSFGDVRIKSTDSVIVAHKVILASSSLYFRTLFTTKVGNDEAKGIVKLEDFDSDTVMEVLKFIYTGEVTLSRINIFELMRIEDLLQVWSLRGILASYLQSIIDKENCWSIKIEADFFRYEDVSQSAFMFIIENFKTLITDQQFLEVPYDLIKKCLDSPVLASPTEGVLLCNLVAWVMHDFSLRRQHHEELLSYINPSQLQCWVDSREVVLRLTAPYADARETMNEWLQSAVAFRNIYNTSSYCPRYKHFTLPGLLAIGGKDSDGFGVATVEVTTDMAVNPWRLLLPTSNGGSRLTNHGGLELPPMPEPRAAFASTPVGFFHAYVIGGLLDDDDSTNRVDYYSTITNSWHEAPSLPYSIRHAAAASLDCSIYISGGVVNGRPTSSFMVLPKDGNRWIELSPMSTPRSHHCLVSLCGSLYSIGGLGLGNGALSSVERYDPVSGVWTNVAPLLLARHSFVAIALPNIRSIYAIRGFPVREGRPTIEKYSLKNDDWRLVRSAGSSAVDSWAAVYGGMVGRSVAMVTHRGSSGTEATSTVTIYSTVSEMALDRGPALNFSRWGGALIPVSIPLFKRAPI